MRIVDNAVAPIVEQMNKATDDMNRKIEEMGVQIAAVAAFGMVAFVLISIVAVTALVKASRV